MMDNEKQYDLALKNLGEVIQSLYESREYSCGRFVLRIVNYLKHAKFISLFRYLNKLVRARRVDKDSNSSVELPERRGTIPIASTGEYTVTVYTCILNGYDKLYPPIFKPDNYKFIVITDNTNTDYFGWEAVQFPKELSVYTPTEINRYIKTHPDRFCDSDYAIYLDGNILQLQSLDYYIKHINNTSGLAMFSHPLRDCLYKEAEICIRMNKGNIRAVEETINRYKREGMPTHYGLNEGGIVASDLSNPLAIKILDKWWIEVEDNKTNRDQLSLPYVLWKEGMKMPDIGIIGTNLREDNRIVLLKHNVI